MTAFIVIASIVAYLIGVFIYARMNIIDESASIVSATLNLDKMTDRSARDWQRRKIRQDTNALIAGSVFDGILWPVWLVLAVWLALVINPAMSIATRPITKQVEKARTLQNAINVWEKELKEETDPDKLELIKQTIDTLKSNLP